MQAMLHEAIVGEKCNKFKSILQGLWKDDSGK